MAMFKKKEKKIAIFLVIMEAMSRLAKESVKGKQPSQLKAERVEACGEYLEGLREARSLSIQIHREPGTPQNMGDVCLCVLRVKEG